MGEVLWLLLGVVVGIAVAWAQFACKLRAVREIVSHWGAIAADNRELRARLQAYETIASSIEAAVESVNAKVRKVSDDRA